MVGLPPGTMLTLMYLRERLARIAPGEFVEIGPGSGEITGILLSSGWRGTAYDLSEGTIEALRHRFANEVAQGRLATVVGDFVARQGSAAVQPPVDLIISCMVMEHLDDGAEREFMAASATRLKRDGLMIGIVPASENHWGIEDEIAGHFRRYSRQSVAALLDATNFRVGHLAGLTYPVSNVLLPLSDYLVRRHESHKLALSMDERTQASGRRGVPFKTRFPPVFRLLLNEMVMLPLHWVQKLFAKSDRALILYFEASAHGRAK